MMPADPTGGTGPRGAGTTRRPAAARERTRMGFLRRNWLLWSALLLITVGYLLLAGDSITAAPLLLVVGYCIVLPLYLWRSFRGGEGE